MTLDDAVEQLLRDAHVNWARYQARLREVRAADRMREDEIARRAGKHEPHLSRLRERK